MDHVWDHCNIAALWLNTLFVHFVFLNKVSEISHSRITLSVLSFFPTLRCSQCLWVNFNQSMSHCLQIMKAWKGKGEIKWEKTWRQNKKEEGEGKSDALAAHQHCLFQALSSYSSVLVPQSLHQENLREEQHQWGISPSRGGIQSFCIDSANVTSADCFLRFSCRKRCEKRAEIV